MTTPVKTLTLTVFIISLTLGIWGLGWLYEKATQQPVGQPSSVVKTDGKKTEVAWENGKPLADLSFMATGTVAATASSSAMLDMEQGVLLTNPFILSGRLSGLKDAYWQLQDSKDGVLAHGTVSAEDGTGRFQGMGWYDVKPTVEKGTLLIIEPTSTRSSSLASLNVALQTKTQTAELYFWDKSASDGDCSSVFPVKRTIVATQGERVNFYEAALRALLVGPTEQEFTAGLQTALPTSTGLLRVGQDEKGRYVGDFSSDLTKGIDDACRLSAIRAQISRTLTTVYLPGKSLPGRVFVDGKEAAF
jgi:hypothetical protein